MNMLVTQNLRDLLIKRCNDPIEAFASLGESYTTKDGPLTYIDRGGSVLAVAHLDWVMRRKPMLSKQGIIQCPQLDDRLGVWVILDVLPAIGVQVDVLLTDSEEVGASTAGYFIPKKDYNWVFSFDRAGMDVV